jgi:Flp pilus assembly protein TadG
MSKRSILQRLCSDKEGITIVEFALVSPVLMLFVCGTMELSYDLYQRSVIQGVVQRAARKASIGNIQSGEIDAYIRGQVKPALPKASRELPNTINIVKKSYFNFSNVGKPEKITTDTVPLKIYNSTDCYEDANGNKSYDSATGVEGLGGADDIVYYEVTATTPRLFPVAGLLGFTQNVTIKTQTVVRNQPFSAQNAPKIICPAP